MLLLSAISNYKFIQTIRGNTLLMVNGYTYTENNRAKNTYYCSRKYKSCKSSVKLDENGRLTSIRMEHNHCPPVYRSTQNGLYVKFSTDQNPSLYSYRSRTPYRFWKQLKMTISPMNGGHKQKWTSGNKSFVLYSLKGVQGQQWHCQCLMESALEALIAFRFFIEIRTKM